MMSSVMGKYSIVHIWTIALVMLALTIAFYVMSGLCVASTTDNLKDISVCRGHALVLLSNGTVWAWGENLCGACGRTIYGGPDDYEKNFYPSPVMVEGLSNVTAISAGDLFSLALKDDGTVWAWGDNMDGALGIGQSPATGSGSVRITRPTMIPGLSHIVAIDASNNFAMALKDDGTVWAWGSNTFGQLGDGVSTTQEHDRYVTSPVLVTGLTGVKSIYAGTRNCFALKDDGTIWAWGDNSTLLSDMKRDPKATVISTPGKVPSLTNMKSLAVGDYHALGLKDDGTVWSWGLDYDGSLGIGNLGSPYASTNVPTQVQGLSNITEIGASTHSAALGSDGTVWTWGLNKKGQLGDGTTTSRNTPVQMHVPKATMIDVSSENTFTVSGDGTIRGCGDNQGDQLGARKSNTEYLATPVKINFDYGRAQLEPTATSNVEVTPAATEQTVVTDQPEPSPSEQASSTPDSSSQNTGGNSVLTIAAVLFTVIALGFIVYLVIRK